MKKIWAIVMISTLFVLAACGGGASTSTGTGTTAQPTSTPTPTQGSAKEEPKKELEAVKINLGAAATTGGVVDVAAKHFADKVSEKTGGKLTIDIFSTGQLGGDRDLIENVSLGSLPVAMVNIGVLGNFSPALSGIQVPYLLDAELEPKVYNSDFFKKEAFAKVEETNIKPLAFVPQGYLEFGSIDKLFNSLDDVKGVKIRSIETEVLVDSYKELGMNPIPMPFPEMYNALQTGVIEAGAIPLASWETSGMGEVIKYITISDAIASPHLLIINLQAFDDFPKEYQDAIMEAALEMEGFALEFEKEYNQKSIEKLEAQGVTVTKMEQREQFVERMQPIYEKYGEQNPWVKRTVELVQELKK